jgi:hypothetical protein
LYGDGTNVPDYFCTEVEWQTAVTTYGVCGKFVYDSVNNTVRLPKVTGKIEGTTDINALGDLAPLIVKLPNITGSMNAVYELDAPLIADGAFYLETASPQNEGYSLSGQAGRVWKFAASRSSSVYSGNGTDTTIHEQAVNVFYYIVIATSTKTDIQVDIDDIATDLNGKADVDLTNTSPSSSFASTLDTAGIRTIVETYSNDWSWYRVYSDGWCEQGGQATASTNYSASGTVVFLKEFRDTKYQFFIGANLETNAITTPFRETGHRTTSSTGVIGGYILGSTQSFYAYPFMWQANGYIN